MTVPPVADQVTLVLLLPVTLAVNCCVAPVISEAVVGEMETETAVTVTVAEADLVVSATLVAVTVTLPAVAGAVKSPPVVMLPALAVQVTAGLLLPVTVAVNCCVAPVISEAVAGAMETETTTGAVTVTVAAADLVGSATLVALTVKVPAVPGAV